MEHTRTMPFCQSTTATAIESPWEENDLHPLVRFGLTFLFVLLLIVTLVTLFVVVGVSIQMVTGSIPSHYITVNQIALGVALALLISSLFGMHLVWPAIRSPGLFIPHYRQIAPTRMGCPFEVRFPRYLWGRSLRGSGTVQFTPEGLLLDGTLEPSWFFQIGVIVVVTFVPLILFGVGLGLIPALLLAYYLGKKKITHTIPYSALSAINVKGRQVTWTGSEAPRHVSFVVAPLDGERLYRELLPHVPGALNGWLG